MTSLNAEKTVVNTLPVESSPVLASTEAATEKIPVIDFRPLMTSNSMACFYACFVPTFFILFRPSIVEFLVLFAVDLVSLALTIAIDTTLFLRLFPQSRLFFPKLDIEGMPSLGTDEGRSLFKELVRFPRRRAVFCVALSYIKMIPVVCVGVFYWTHTNSNASQAVLLFAAFSLMYGYFYGAIYIDNHDSISRAIGLIHRRYDWEEVFRGVDIGSPRVDFHFQESVTLATIATFMCITQLTVILSTRHEKTSTVALMMLSVALAAFVLFGRLWYVARNYFFGGLRSLFDVLEKFEPEKVRHVLPLHSAALLAQFERTFNELTRRLRAYEEEFSHWLFVQTEQSRFKALGEVSALIVHDLSSPLQVVNFCAEGIREDLPEEKKQRYLEQLVQNSQRSLELISSWKAYLKNQSSDSNFITFRECLEYVRTLLSTQFEPAKFHAIQFTADSELDHLVIKIPRAELIHILFNLVSNSTENLISNQIENPSLSILKGGQDAATVSILVRDNGTGLSVDKFEELTSFMYLPRPGMPARGGLGLRLIRRLIERRGGSLKVIPQPDGLAGTTFCLQLEYGV